MPISPRSIRTLAAVSTAVIAVLALMFHFPGPGEGNALSAGAMTTISGRVTDRSGLPVANSYVSAYNLDTGSAFAAEGDSNGFYQIDIHEPGNYRLSGIASSNGFMQTFWTSAGGVLDYLQAEPVPVAEPLGQFLTGYNIALFRSSTISGRVTDNAGTPLSDVQVSPQIQNDDCLLCASDLTDADGEYTVVVEPGIYWLFIYGGLYSPASRHVIAGLEEDIRLPDVKLSRYGMIQGTVRDRDGNPLPEAMVSALSSCCSTDAFTDERGEYTMMALVPGDYIISASLAGYRTAYWTPPGSVESPADAVAVASQLETVISGIDLVLSPKGSISGRLTNFDGNGIPGGGVVASKNDFQCCEFWWAPTDDDGYYKIIDLETGDYKLYGNAGSVYALGFYTSSGGTTEMAQAEAVHVEFGFETPGVDFHLLRYGSIAGRVTDVQGNPIAGAEVRAYFPECTGCTPPSTLADAEGYYRFEALEPRDYVLGAFAGDHIPQFWSSTGNVRRWEDATVILPELEQVLTGVDFSLPRPASIQGRVVDSAGNPIQGATVSLTVVGCPGCGAGYLTNSDGEYSLPGLPPGQITLAAYKQGYYPPGGYTSTYWTSDGGSPWEPEVISVSDGAHLAGFDITLRHPGAVHGTVSDVHGDPLNGVKVELLSDLCSQCVWAYTSTTGDYWIIVPVGEYRVSASLGGYVTEFWTASGGTSNASRATSVEVTEGATVHGINFRLLPEACAPADVTGDTRVNVFDIVAVARAMGSRPGRHNWNPDADVNGDGRIDVRDLRVVIEAFWSADCR